MMFAFSESFMLFVMVYMIIKYALIAGGIAAVLYFVYWLGGHNITISTEKK